MCSPPPRDAFAGDAPRGKRAVTHATEQTGVGQLFCDTLPMCLTCTKLQPLPAPAVRPGHEWYQGEPGSYTDDELRRLSGLQIGCPGCTVADIWTKRCHTTWIVDEFLVKFPNLPPPVPVSLGSKNVPYMRKRLMDEDTVYCGCSPPRGFPHSREFGIKLPISKFGNPAIMKRRREKAAAKTQSLTKPHN